jgi:hypothetical protein
MAAPIRAARATANSTPSTAKSGKNSAQQPPFSIYPPSPIRLPYRGLSFSEGSGVFAMNGVALVLALSALGVDYNVQTAEDGKVEYVVQMEPELLRPLADGQKIHSDVPLDAGNVERILIRVGTIAPKHSQANITAYRRLLVEAGRVASTDGRGVADPTASIFWPAKNKPALNYNVTYGWQPDAQGVLSYFVQIDPVLLQSLVIGDEIRAGIDPAAGRIGRFVIQVGSEDLPKIPVEPVGTARTDAAAGRTRFAPSASGSISDLYPGASKSTYGPAPSTTAPLGRPTVPLTSTPDYGPAAATPPEQQPLYSPAPRGGIGFNSGVSDVATNLGTPTFDPQTQPNYAPTQLAYNDPRFTQPRGALQPPPLAYGPQNYVANTAGQQSQMQPQATYPPPASYAPAPVPQDRVASVNRPATTTGASAHLPAPQINTTSVTKPPAESASDSKPYLTMMVAFALFVSIGANMYLGWTAGEYYSRYRLATERLRSASRA